MLRIRPVMLPATHLLYQKKADLRIVSVFVSDMPSEFVHALNLVSHQADVQIRAGAFQ